VWDMRMVNMRLALGLSRLCTKSGQGGRGRGVSSMRSVRLSRLEHMILAAILLPQCSLLYRLPLPLTFPCMHLDVIITRPPNSRHPDRPERQRTTSLQKLHLHLLLSLPFTLSLSVPDIYIFLLLPPVVKDVRTRRNSSTLSSRKDRRTGSARVRA
jgi:hypothetical protein